MTTDNKDTVPDLISTDRLEAFSDVVFGVAITLLILSIQVPHLKDIPGRDLLPTLANEWASWLSYILSFANIGIGWINHHQLFRRIKKVDVILLTLNLLILLFATIIPFPTALLAEYFRDADGQRAAAAIYGITHVGISSAFLFVWLYASFAHLLDEHVTSEAIRAGIRRRIIGITLYIVATALVLVNALVSVGMYFAIAIYYLITSNLRQKSEHSFRRSD